MINRILPLGSAFLITITLGIPTAVAEQQERPDKAAVRKLVNPSPVSQIANPNNRREQLVHAHCARCHMLPDPAVFPKRLWVNQVLPEMGCYLGVHNLIPQYKRFMEGGSTPEEGELFKERVIYPEQPLLTQADWDEIVLWYMEKSPDNSPPSTHKQHPPIPKGKFETVWIGPKNPIPEITLVKIDEKHQRFFVSNAITDSLSIHDAQGNLLSEQVDKGTFTVAHLDHQKNEHHFISVGVLRPNDILAGGLWKVTGNEGLESLEQLEIPLLKRPVSAVWHDFDKDGQEEIVIAEYGHKTGQLSLCTKTKSGKWIRKKILNLAAGNKTVKLADMNQDGWQDLVVLRAQEMEDVLIYYNLGDLNFEESYALKFPPYWGSNDFELADLNGDGHLDLILTNGDNGDSTDILKNFHGIRIYQNDQRNNFELTQSIPMHGAYSVRAMDHDGDGDLDLLAFSTFPDFSIDQKTILLLDHVAPMEFEAYSVPDSNLSRWIAMDIGDIDNDGDIDALFAPFLPGPSKMPPPLVSRAAELAHPFLLMKNLSTP